MAVQPKLQAAGHELVSASDFRSQPDSWITKPKLTGRPVVVTEDGRAAVVLISPEMLDHLEDEREVVHLVLQGLREMATGDLFEDAEVWRGVEEILSRAKVT